MTQGSKEANAELAGYAAEVAQVLTERELLVKNLSWGAVIIDRITFEFDGAPTGVALVCSEHGDFNLEVTS